MLEVALRAARREAERGARRARRVADDHRAHLAAGALASGLLLATLYTESAECSALEAAQKLDSDVSTARDEGEFNRLMERWTKAATLYSAALKEVCPKAQYALGRLCFEGRGYVYDSELGVALYDSAAANGNPDAQFALANIEFLGWTLQLNKLPEPQEELPEQEEDLLILHAQQARVYRFSRLLYLASRKGHEKAKGALSDIYKLDLNGPAYWMRNTNEFLLTAARTSGTYSNDARAQAYLRGGERPKKGEGGWRARVLAADPEDAPALIAYTMQRKSNGEAEPSEMHAVSRLAKWYTHEHGDVRAKAKALRDEAARMGDIQAINDQYDSADKNDPKTIASILSRGVKVGSSRLLLERGRMYRRQNKANEAERDFVYAAELGVWDALQEYLAMHGAQSEQVEVSPLSAALEVLKMRTHRALCERQRLAPPFVVAALPADSASIQSMHAGARDVPRATPGAATSRPEVVTSNITWPKINVSATHIEMSELQSVYADVLKTMDDIEKEWELGPRDQITLLLEPLPREMLGRFAGDAPEITARALLLALQERRPRAKITMCVFESIPTVAAYARAFRTLGS